MNRRRVAILVALAALFALPATAVAGHNLKMTLDHAGQPIQLEAPPSNAFTSGGPGAKWELLRTFPTGNPHTDVDFFTQGANTFVSAGTLGIGPNQGGQEIFQLTDGGKVAPKPVSSHGSASCLSNAADATGLQHDVEATPKGNAILNADVTSASREDTQLLLDATDAPGRCHDQGVFGAEGVPQGGLEIIDVTDIKNPVEIGFTSHIGEAHTVNVDPRRPHIAYASTSDSIGVNPAGARNNETGSSLNLDGFEMVDLSSCMNFPAGTTVAAKRARCRPQVYRYRYPSIDMALGHTNKNSVYGCHELEVYPDDRLMCAGGNALIGMDMSGAFDNRGTPANPRDDKPRGTALPCTVRDSSSAPPFGTGAKIVDCVDGPAATTTDLGVPGWKAQGSPSLTGVRWIGSAFHQGRESATGAANPAFDSTKDIDFNHEAELTASGRYLLATDERGGGILPPGATCSTTGDVSVGNGGVHLYDVNKLLHRRPTSADDAFSSYAKNSKGAKAIYRAPIRTRPQESICTAHVFQQIPGQNRIFMGWYSQGTQVVDFTENADGTVDFKEAGYFIPASANEWVSHIFKVDRNADGSFTYYGTTADFALGSAGRNAVEVYKATLPAPPTPRGRLAGTGAGFQPTPCLASKVRIGRKNIGRLKLGQGKKATARRAGPPLGNISRKTRTYRYCVKKSKKARGVAVFDTKGRIRIAATNRGSHRYGKTTPGTRVKTLRKRYGKRLRKLSKTTRVVRSKRGAVVFGLRKGKVSYIAVADRSVARKGKTLRGYVKRLGLR